MNAERHIDVAPVCSALPHRWAVDPWVTESVLGPMQSISDTDYDARTVPEPGLGLVCGRHQADIIVAANTLPRQGALSHCPPPEGRSQKPAGLTTFPLRH